ncbi:hypothetical protein L198_03209 [Cryptococcus wingfieldii CBS 7118]|uniref:BAR domain-containing protein n=1 Tax=Cryptococcus wingfieldii CBS 7118 TaxID=1295528 RepID=A0A1E3JEV0_9TREE|nr:hypothetical protein L198_03209 [Cryptococcus wingfieldii CBS 7118]ODN99367.1 hypothetical protein L198_03209 [Cryptococcus wingfieldii CBS 7118]
MSTERQAEPTPSQGDEVQDEFSRISEETFQITEDFMSQLETNITNDLKGYESYFENAKDSIYDEVEKEKLLEGSERGERGA